MTWRIAIVGACPYPVPQGSQVFLRDMAMALRERGHDVRLAVYGHGAGDDDSGLAIHRSRALPGVRRTKAGPSVAKPLLDLALVNTLRGVIREHQTEIVLAHNYEGLLAALAARARPIVYQAHNAMADELPYYFGRSRVAGALGSWLDRTLPKRADHVIVPHGRLAEYLISCGCDASRVSVVAPPSCPGWPEPDPPAGECPPLLYTGNLDAYQNLNFLQAVVRRVREAVPEARFVVATAESEGLPEADHVHTPDLESLKAVLSRDAVVLCPRVSWSGYPIKLLNAMAAGKPIVACRSAAHPLKHERTGILVDDNDETAFADAVLLLMQSPDLRRTLGEAGREQVRQFHAPGRVAEQLESALAAAAGH
jgi:glycosyltransferase involved in cell wall biosynthesis